MNGGFRTTTPGAFDAPLNIPEEVRALVRDLYHRGHRDQANRLLTEARDILQDWGDLVAASLIWGDLVDRYEHRDAAVRT